MAAIAAVAQDVGPVSGYVLRSADDSRPSVLLVAASIALELGGRASAIQSNGTFVPVRLPLVNVAPIEIVHRHGHVIRVHDVASLRCVLEALAADSADTEA
jgi:hypothetical protein